MVGRQGWHLKRGQPRPWQARGDRLPHWRGDAVSPSGGRERARDNYPIIEQCERCDAPAVDRHHKNGNTANNHRSNIEFLCRRCHMRVDGRLDQLIARAKAPRTLKPPEPCVICGQPYKPRRHGRCAACNEYFRRHGRDREARAS